MENRKQIMIGVLSVIVCIMAVGYAYLSQQLTVNGTAHIDSTWDVRITNITGTPTTVSGGAAGTSANLYDATSNPTGGTKVLNSASAVFDATLMNPGDYVTYTVTVANYGTLPAGLSTITPVYKSVTGTSPNEVETVVSNLSTDAIVYTIDEGLVQYKEIPAANGNTPSTITFTITATYNSNIEEQPTGAQLKKKLELTLNFVQDMHPSDATQN